MHLMIKYFVAFIPVLRNKNPFPNLGLDQHEYIAFIQIQMKKTHHCRYLCNQLKKKKKPDYKCSDIYHIQATPFNIP